MGAMNRPSEVPPPVDSLGVMCSSSCTARVAASDSVPGTVRNGYPEMNHSSEYLTRCRSRMRSTAALSESTVCSVENRRLKRALSSPGNHVRCARARRDIGDLKGGRLKVLIAVIPGSRGELGERGRHGVNRIVRELRIRDVPLHAVHREPPAQAPPAADLDGVAEQALARRLSHQAPVDGLVAAAQHLDHAASAVDRGSLLVAGDQKRDAAGMSGIPGDEFLAGGHHRGEAALHVGGAPAVQRTVADGGRERIAVPLLERSGGHHIGVPGEAEQRSFAPASGPEVLDRPEFQVLHAKADCRQPFAHQRLASAVGRAHRRPRHQFAGQRQRIRHQNRRTGGQRRRFAHNPQAPRHRAQISTHAGIASPRKRQSILAHSPDPVSTLLKTSVSGKTFSMNSSDAPQAGTLSGGRLCMYSCRAATPMVASAASASRAA